MFAGGRAEDHWFGKATVQPGRCVEAVEDHQVEARCGWASGQGELGKLASPVLERKGVPGIPEAADNV